MASPVEQLKRLRKLADEIQSRWVEEGAVNMLSGAEAALKDADSAWKRGDLVRAFLLWQYSERLMESAESTLQAQRSVKASQTRPS